MSLTLSEGIDALILFPTLMREHKIMGQTLLQSRQQSISPKVILPRPVARFPWAGAGANYLKGKGGMSQGHAEDAVVSN